MPLLSFRFKVTTMKMAVPLAKDDLPVDYALPCVCAGFPVKHGLLFSKDEKVYQMSQHKMFQGSLPLTGVGTPLLPTEACHK